MTATPNTIRVGTRGSLLARTQTNWVMRCLAAQHPDLQFETIVIQTSGDVHSGRIPARFAGKGFFTKEIEEALLADEIDLAVHSLKDLPTQWPEGLGLGAVPVREDPRDALVGGTTADLAANPTGLRIGTSSLRRSAQLKSLFKGCRVENLRGNLDTRLRKVSDGVVDVAVLAAAGLHRLGREGEITDLFQPDAMLPAPGQGALGIEIRAGDERLRGALQAIHCSETCACVEAERAFMQQLGGGCQVPIGAYATLAEGVLRLHGRAVALDGQWVVEGRQQGAPADADDIGRRLADDLLAQGAGDIMRDIDAYLNEDNQNA